jgi:hypothetical protein
LAAEYGDKQLAVLIADEARLTEEFKKDLDAEVEKRFQDGRYRKTRLPAHVRDHNRNHCRTRRCEDDQVRGYRSSC